MVGFDDIRFADFPEIGLTTVRQPNYEMGKLTADILLDCIVIATNFQTHCEIICAAAEAGSKYVFTEKPLGMPMDEVNLIKATLEAHTEMLLQVGYNHRFDPDLCAAKKKVDSGFVGDIILLRIESRDQAGSAGSMLTSLFPALGYFLLDRLGQTLSVTNIVHNHICYSLMIIEIIYVNSAVILKPENNTPVARHRYGPMALILYFQRV